jgi:hypothetical protein
MARAIDLPCCPEADTGAMSESDRLREAAREAYSAGRLDEAIRLQQSVGTATAAAPLVEDALFLGLLLHGAQRFDAAIAVLRDAANRFPDHAAVDENLGVLLLASGETAASIAACHHAIAQGSDSMNVLDCLADAYSRIGRVEQAIAFGRAALEAKDRRFGAGKSMARVPSGPPPPFNPLQPAENVIAYCLWGNEPRYRVPLQENVRILPHLFPGWTIRLYHDADVDHGFLSALATRGVDLRPMTLAAGQPDHRRLLWRFEVIADPTVRRFLIRDADSILSVKERVAVDAWLQSRYHFHAMRDWYTHTDLLLAGMWGGVGAILPPPARLLDAYTGWRIENDHVDQDVLTETVWPTARHSLLIHDSIFTGCLGSVAFPPYGDLPPGLHIGQNAFASFSRAG